MREKRWYVSPEVETNEASLLDIVATSDNPEETTAPGWGDGGDLFNF